jgi:hypothetical protein
MEVRRHFGPADSALQVRQRVVGPHGETVGVSAVQRELHGVVLAAPILNEMIDLAVLREPAARLGIPRWSSRRVDRRVQSDVSTPLSGGGSDIAGTRHPTGRHLTLERQVVVVGQWRVEHFVERLHEHGPRKRRVAGADDGVLRLIIVPQLVEIVAATVRI